MILFSFATGSLISLVQNYDNSSAILEQKLQYLNLVERKYDLPYELSLKIKSSLKQATVHQCEKAIQELCTELPFNLKMELTQWQYLTSFGHVGFFKD